MALSDAELWAVWDGVWESLETDPRTIREVETLAIRAVADAAVAEFCREVMES